MRKNLTRVAMLACTFALSLASMSAAAAPLARQGTEDRMEEGSAETVEDTGHEEGMDEAGDADGATEGSTDEAGEAPETADAAGGIPARGHMTAEQLKEEKGGGAAAIGTVLYDGGWEEDADGEDVPDGEGSRPAYTAPEDTRHANVSFSFNEEAASAYFSKLTYPLTLGLKEVDTRKKISMTIKSEGQILEVDKGDYTVTSLKDSGKIPLSIAADTLHIYENTEYPVRFAANSALKMFTDFLADNIFLGVFLVFAAIFYQKVFIPRFASDVRRR